MNKAKAFLFTALAMGLSHQVLAQDLTVKMTDLQTGKPVGTIELSQNKYGVVFTPELADLTPGMHGFHIHQNGNCDSIEKNGKVVLGGAAGGITILSILISMVSLGLMIIIKVIYPRYLSVPMV